ncbi:O-sialoglycoprotein endopeptidase [Anaerobranca gottschalkii]|uniref:N(6)-L-threonylcarbamoyladenine synthase n=1 Tax=Anaerobranca gottschalkii DSM 13577 TaxID=1120990 RepID=A0A1H9Y2B4_9FIRM|nr:O-sialoglycoprotein endopeptidase [Anaerobranca gottschalkii]SES62855.1 N6-L-threonylcarbamoyladenine synthase [Anaerobranca gottschalkii DSM 13577]
MKLYLGIDTSNYTTSLAVVSEKDEIIYDRRKILSVEGGKRGLRQSEAFFQHNNNFPEMFSLLKGEIELDKIAGIAVSTKPRNIENSYMPVFKAGSNYAQVLSDVLNIPLIECSHQEGHIYAGMVPLKLQPPFLAFHLSGGTTDLLLVKEGGSYRLDIELLTSSSDLHCGQFVDRMGVLLGLTFPAGKELDNLAQSSEKVLTIPSSVKDGVPSFSGPLTFAEKLIQRGEKKEDIALAVFKCIAKTVEKVLSFGIANTGLNKILLIGGVASNSYIRKYIKEKVRGEVYFAPPQLSPDNAVGVAFMGKKELTRNI